MKKITLVTSAASFLAGLFIVIGLSSSAHAYVEEVIVNQAPPPPREEIITQIPGPQERWVWQKGHWRWWHDRYIWSRGHWVARPERAAVWVEPHWDERPNGWVYVKGHWQ